MRTSFLDHVLAVVYFLSGSLCLLAGLAFLVENVDLGSLDVPSDVKANTYAGIICGETEVLRNGIQFSICGVEVDFIIEHKSGVLGHEVNKLTQGQPITIFAVTTRSKNKNRVLDITLGKNNKILDMKIARENYKKSEARHLLLSFFLILFGVYVISIGTRKFKRTNRSY